ncbi:hypothetical protein FDG2_6083 [Candidatus Protofrankia californiensis]|uniref:Uncharacterized protein n=1 Tax=Candidatus Protofrankia californiensis TaxID=1839754 RepID=A0A1C3PGC9_9ACTN|nr:hypothetical protein FDG2_6083 [Candidatus Protofrankia californiensis]
MKGGGDPVLVCRKLRQQPSDEIAPLAEEGTPSSRRADYYEPLLFGNAESSPIMIAATARSNRVLTACFQGSTITAQIGERLTDSMRKRR